MFTLSPWLHRLLYAIGALIVKGISGPDGVTVSSLNFEYNAMRVNSTRKETSACNVRKQRLQRFERDVRAWRPLAVRRRLGLFPPTVPDRLFSFFRRRSRCPVSLLMEKP